MELYTIFILYLSFLILILVLFSNKKQSASHYQKDYPLVEVFEVAIRNRYRIKIQYESSPLYKDNEITERIIQPLEIKYGKDILDNDFIKNSENSKDKIYIKAFCELRQDERHFRLDRLQILKILK